MAEHPCELCGAELPVPRLAHADSVSIGADPAAVYALVTDIARTGEWSPICRSAWWDEGGGPRPGAWFTGHNEAGGAVWETRSQVEVAEPPREFAWLVGQGFVRWGYSIEPDGAGSRLTESWQLRPAGLVMFHERYGADAHARIALRAEQALAGIPETLAALKRIAEAGA